MKIGIVSTNSFPIPYKTHTGDVVILDLAKSLVELGHEVSMYAPEGTQAPGALYPVLASYGKYPPSTYDCEIDCLKKHYSSLLREDVIHDFSVNKHVLINIVQQGKRGVGTIMGGPWTQKNIPANLIVWSRSHRDRVLRGASDFEGTSTPDLGGHVGIPIKEAKIVHGGIDTNFYQPGNQKENYFLWMNRWHPAKGYKMAIALAKATGIKLILAGEHPDNEVFEYQKQCALEAITLAKNSPNITFEWLPSDPLHHLKKIELYQKARALLYTVDFCEPFGLSQVESLACGTPVIGTNFGSVPEIILNGQVGFVRKNNLHDLASALSLIDSISPVKCREYAVEKFDRKIMAQRYLDKYQSVLQGEVW